jgi:hypothetical protein
VPEAPWYRPWAVPLPVVGDELRDPGLADAVRAGGEAPVERQHHEDEPRRVDQAEAEVTGGEEPNPAAATARGRSSDSGSAGLPIPRTDQSGGNVRPSHFGRCHLSDWLTSESTIVACALRSGAGGELLTNWRAGATV